MSFDDRWLPYLGDQVTVQMGNQPSEGRASRYDPALVEVDTALRVQVGEIVEASWQVAGEPHYATAVVEDVTTEGFTVRLPLAPTVTESRRQHERVNLSVWVALSGAQGGSMAEQLHYGRTLDLSNGGARALIDAAEPLAIGELLQVRLELGDEVETLSATVVWEHGHGAGERVAGLRFTSEVVASKWAALATQAG